MATDRNPENQTAEISNVFEGFVVEPGADQWLLENTLKLLRENPNQASQDIVLSLLGLPGAPEISKELAETLEPGIETVKAYLEEENSSNEELETQKEKITQHIFYTDPDYQAKSTVDDLFEVQKKELEGGEPNYKKAIQEQHLAELKDLYKAMDKLESINPDASTDFIDEFGAEIWAPGNQAFIDAIADRNPSDIDKALKLIQKAADTIDQARADYREADNYLKDSGAIERTISHLFETEQDPRDIDIEKLFRMLSSVKNIELPPQLKEYAEKRLLKPYVDEVHNKYQTKLNINQQVVEGTYDNILREAQDQNFATRADFDDYVRTQMKGQLPEFFDRESGAWPLPNNVWDQQKNQRINQADRTWENYLNKGEKKVWETLTQALNEADKKSFASKDDYIAYLKETTQVLNKDKVIPNETWDNRVQDLLRDRAERQWQKKLEQGRSEANKMLDQAFAKASKKDFKNFEELQDFLKKTTSILDSKKVLPDEYWDSTVRPIFHARSKVLWSKLDQTKQADLERVESVFKNISLSPDRISGHPKTNADFVRIAKSQIPDSAKGRLSDPDWDMAMKAYFYPKVESELRSNEATVAKAMSTFQMPGLADRLECGSQEQYLSLVKSRFAEKNKNALGLITNAQYDNLRNNRLLLPAREAWRSHEQSEANAFREAQAALSNQNLLKTVHHFAKQKQVKNPNVAQIKESSSHALTSQFGLRPDQIKTLDGDLQTYASQALALHSSRRNRAGQVVKNYQVPAGTRFTPDQLKNSANFYDAMVAVNGFMKFDHEDDWYLIQDVGMSHIEALRKQQIKLTQNPETDPASLKVAEKKALETDSQELQKNQKSTESKHPTEQTDWMSRYGIPCEAVSQKGVDRFNSLMTLPEFSFGNIPQSDLRTVLPALVNMAGGMIDRTWKNFRLILRDAIRNGDTTSPNARLFTIVKTFALGYPFKPNDFDLVGGVDNTFNNLIKRMKGPEGEKFSSIKNLYRHFALSGEESAVEDLIESGEIEEFLDEGVPEEETEEINTENEEISEETTLQTPTEKVSEQEETEEPELLPENTLEPEVDEAEIEAEEEEALAQLEPEILETKTESPETETEMPAEIVSEDQDQVAGELPTEEGDELQEVDSDEEEVLDIEELDADLLLQEEAEAAEKELEDEEAEIQAEAEALETEELETEEEAEEDTKDMAEAYQDYLQEGAVVLTEVDQILRTPNVSETEEELEVEEELQAIIDGENLEQEDRPEEQKSPIDEAAELVPEKIHKFLLKLSARGLMSDEAWAWILDRSTEFKADDTGAVMTLQTAIDLVQVILQSQFLGKKIKFETRLDSSSKQKKLFKAEKFIEQFLDQVQVVDGLQAVVINGHRDKKLRGYFVTRQTKKTFSVSCHLGQPLPKMSQYN